MSYSQYLDKANKNGLAFLLLGEGIKGKTEKGGQNKRKQHRIMYEHVECSMLHITPM